MSVALIYVLAVYCVLHGCWWYFARHYERKFHLMRWRDMVLCEGHLRRYKGGKWLKFFLASVLLWIIFSH